MFVARNGVKVEVPRRLMHEFKEIFLEDVYFSGMRDGLPERPVIFDVGANAGFFSLFSASRFPSARIYAFEPVPANFQQLSRNADHNSKVGLTCFPVAVCGHDGEIFLSFELEGDFTTSATVVQKQVGGTASGVGQTVPCVSLATVFQEQRIARCDLLKLDCEGAEFEILYNCKPETLIKIQRLAMEVHEGGHAGHDMTSLAAYLVSHGFVVTHRRHMLWAWRNASY